MMDAYCSYSDQELTAFLKNGDKSAFTEIYNRYWKKMFALACQKINDPEEAREIVQQIFIRLWERKDKLEINNTLGGYLSVSVKYRIINALNMHYVRKNYIDNLPAWSELDDSTQEWLDFEEVKERLAILVSNLPEKCRIVFVMSREQGLSQKKIAETLNISEKTVEAHLSKAVKSLRTGLRSFFLTLL
ncbi:RNA polymerase sigma-70 factor [Pedobacter hiemivivus]|nr:RNA polymerase sigma-70 factor [Pedobacter hiemivivus]